MLLGFKINTQEDLEELLHFAGCESHWNAAITALLRSVRNFQDHIEAGGEADTCGFVGIQIVGEDSLGEDPGQGGAWTPMEGPPQEDGEGPDLSPESLEFMNGLLGALFAGIPRTDPRLN